MRQSDRNKRSLIIIGLCSIAIIMAVGFAAFAQQLQINSTSEVTSSWDVHIKDNGVSYKNAVDATSTLAEKTSALVATFACTLTTPGTSTISYDVVVENKGTLNARLDSIVLSGGNTAISVVTSPTNASLSTSPIILGPDDETTITVTVSYNNINTQPTGDGALTNIIATLNFSQTADSPAPATNYVYAYHTTDKCVTDECVQDHPSYSTTITDGVSDYTQLSSYQDGKTWFLKYELDGNNVIQNAWSCQKFSFINEPVCLQGGNASDYTANRGIIEGLATTFTSNGGSCSADDYYGKCNVGDLNVYAYSPGGTGAVEYSEDEWCSIGDNGHANCY